MSWLGDLKRFFQGFITFISEEEGEGEHAQDDLSPNSGVPPLGRAASVGYFSPKTKRVLFVKRASDEKNWPDTWSWPGGQCDGEEGAYDAVRRESQEEIGHVPEDDGQWINLGTTRTPHGWDHTSFLCPVDDEFEPKLNAEHSAYCWRGLDDLPDPLHPGVRETLAGTAKRYAADVEFRTGPGKVLQPFVDLSRSNLVDKEGGLTNVTAAQMREQSRQPTVNVEAEDASDPTGKLSKTTREEVDSTAHREDMPESAFLIPSQRKYPVKEKRDGEWKYTRNLLLAAARRARLQGRGDLARRADSIREREFGADIGQDKDTVRSKDAEGRLHVERSNLAMERVDPYFGHEIPNSEELGLDPDKKYMLYRSAEELSKPETVRSANNIPILGQHAGVDAKTHAKNAQLVVGSTGTDARWDAPFISNSLVFWPQEAIDEVEANSKRELSPGYRYIAKMEPGTSPDGEHYDGLMCSIRFQHLAQVEEGRQGKDVTVADTMSRAYGWDDVAAALRSSWLE
jgi:8-oxo-dGTP pyrophosphatase MutT (NUDIX family)